MDTSFLDRFPRFGESTKTYTLATGEYLFREGDVRDTFYYIDSGQLEIFKHSDEPFTILTQNDFCCEQALTEPTSVHTKNGRVREPLVVRALSGKQYEKIAKKYPGEAREFLGYLMAILSNRLHHADLKLATVYHTGRLLSMYQDIRGFGVDLLQAILQAIKARRAFLALFRGLDAEFVALHGFQEENFAMRVSVMDDPLLGVVYRSGETVVIERAQKNMYRNLFYASDSMLLVPILAKRRCIGVIGLVDKEHEDFSLNNRVLLEIISRQVAGALRIALMSRLSAARDSILEKT